MTAPSCRERSGLQYAIYLYVNLRAIHESHLQKIRQRSYGLRRNSFGKLFYDLFFDANLWKALTISTMGIIENASANEIA